MFERIEDSSRNTYLAILRQLVIKASHDSYNLIGVAQILAAVTEVNESHQTVILGPPKYLFTSKIGTCGVSGASGSCGVLSVVAIHHILPLPLHNYV